MASDYVLAADLGGTNLRVAAVDLAGSLLAERRCPTPRSGTASDIVDALVREAAAASDTVGGQPRAFGVAAAALIDSGGSRVLSAPNLPVLNDLVLSEVISEKLRISVVLENDATAAAIGEHWLGAARGAEHFICLTLGTGVGGGLILDGKPYRGAGGTAGEIGHINVEPEGAPCGCGSHGCLEQYASATGLTRMARELIAKDPDSSLASVADLSADDIYEAAKNGDAAGLECFRQMGRYLGMAIADLIDVLNPQVIAIGGGVAAGWDAFIDHLRCEVKERAFRHPAELARIVRAELGDFAGILGAARIAIEAAD